MFQKRQKFRCNQTRNHIVKSTERNKKVSVLKHHCLQWENDNSFLRQKDQSDNFQVFGPFESSIKAFDNIFENYVFLMNTVLLKFPQTFAFCQYTGMPSTLKVWEMGGNVAKLTEHAL